MKNIQQLKRELAAAGLSVVVTAVALSSATYAWFVTNNKVEGTTSTISATTNGFILQIGELSKGAQHGGELKSLEATSKGATLSPASTDDLKNWYVCQSFNNQGLITDYSEPAFATGANAIPGNYDKDYFAFIKSDYIVYTITETGTADVYLDASDGAPVTITSKGGDGSKTVTDSMRVAIEETERRRKIQQEYNEAHGITPTTIQKSVRELISVSKKIAKEEMNFKKSPESMNKAELTKLIADIQKKMEKAAADLNFEAAAEYRDKMIELKGMLRDL